MFQRVVILKFLPDSRGIKKMGNDDAENMRSPRIRTGRKGGGVTLGVCGGDYERDQKRKG